MGSNSTSGSTDSLSTSNGNSVNFESVFEPSHALFCLGSDFNSNNMTSHSHFFYKSRTLKRPVLVTLPDGTTKVINTVGKIKLNPSLTSHQVLLVPKFKYNFLSVAKLL